MVRSPQSWGQCGWCGLLRQEPLDPALVGTGDQPSDGALGRRNESGNALLKISLKVFQQLQQSAPFRRERRGVCVVASQNGEIIELEQFRRQEHAFPAGLELLEQTLQGMASGGSWLWMTRRALSAFSSVC